MGRGRDEFLRSAEYVLAGGNPHVILCEAGIRAFGMDTRPTLDLSAPRFAALTARVCGVASAVGRTSEARGYSIF